MSKVYVTSDWHFGHTNITKFRTQFPSMQHMEDYVLENALEIVTKRDVMFCLGDMAFDMRGLQKMRELPCRLILVRGNHDYLRAADYLTVFDEVHGALKYKGYWMTHIPVHPMELYRGVNIHGHCHRGGPYEAQNGDRWWDYFNAILEFNDYKPIDMQVIGETIAERKRRYQQKKMWDKVERD